MFKNRKITVTVDKKDKTQTQETELVHEGFSEKAEVILQKLESLGAKMFLGVCVYVILDTHRQVSVERAKRF